MPRLLPYRTLRYAVPKTPEEVASSLRQHVRQTSGFSLTKTDEPFRGQVTTDGFKLVRQIRYRNSFIPMILGTVRRAGNGSEISVVMRLHLFVAGFVAVWMTLVLTALLGIVSSTSTIPLVAVLVPLGMLAACALMTTLGFKFEADRAERMLGAIFGDMGQP